MPSSRPALKTAAALISRRQRQALDAHCPLAFRAHLNQRRYSTTTTAISVYSTTRHFGKRHLHPTAGKDTVVLLIIADEIEVLGKAGIG
jgi:hypothetical protein